VLASAGLHCVLGVAALLAADYLEETYPAAQVYRGFRIEWVHRDEPLLYAPPTLRNPEPARPPARQAISRLEIDGAELPARASGGIRPSRRFELAELPRRTRHPELLLQPQFPVEMAPIRRTRLPEMMFWSAEAPRIAPPAPKRFVAPGRETPRPEEPHLAEAPQLAVPSPTSGNEGLRTLETVLIGEPKLTAAPPARAPLRVFKPPTAQGPTPVPIDVSPGDAASVLSLQADPAAMTAILSIPAGNQLGTIQPPPDDATGASAISARSGAGHGSGAGNTAVGAGNRNSAGAAIGNGNAPGSGAAGSGTSTDAPGGSTAVDSAAGANGNGWLTASVPIRIVHPENGTFDIIVMQTSSESDEDTAVLSGRPVYTVFLKVGASAEWILRYCVPNASNVARVTATGVELTDSRPVKPPYPRLTTAPMGAHRASLILHGFITAQGKFRALCAVRSGDEEAARLIAPHLNQWDFRPASRGGRPVEVEIVLIIPSSS
jgi:hypothetical protein